MEIQEQTVTAVPSDIMPEAPTLDDKIKARWPKMTPENAVQLADFVRNETREANLATENDLNETRRLLEIARDDAYKAQQTLEFERKRTDDYVIKASEAQKELEEHREEMDKLREMSGDKPLDDIETLLLPAGATKGDLLRSARRVGEWVDKCRMHRQEGAYAPDAMAMAEQDD